ncbi:hypothetical protein JOB18_021219 [Solea senegalensis]|uniref:Uncharacterized protein n=1 Tax=Solea senegalensis TaxID=28829 RepID=A0AAV6RJJ4_SOLSE|nr:hypothetical protein JOB18_021219 [Solea senegalensis]
MFLILNSAKPQRRYVRSVKVNWSSLGRIQRDGVRLDLLLLIGSSPTQFIVVVFVNGINKDLNKHTHTLSLQWLVSPSLRPSLCLFAPPPPADSLTAAASARNASGAVDDALL